jgi:predicted Rossmann fold nucleotide-binding protein DprA/Smf involved in DNA uptake
MRSLSENGLIKGKPLAATLWQWGGPTVLTGCGAQELLDLELTAFFASRQCPGSAIRAAMDWALQQASAKRAVVSGFHSPLEQSVLKVLMAAGSPAVVVLARPVQGVTLPTEWVDPLEKGHMAVVSSLAMAGRLTQQLATERNALAARLAERIVVAYASPNGSLAAQVSHWQQEGLQVEFLAGG